MTTELSPNSSSQGLDRLVEFLRALSESRFWGSLSVRFEAGHPVHLREERTWPIDKLPSNKSRYYDGNNTKLTP